MKKILIKTCLTISSVIVLVCIAILGYFIYIFSLPSPVLFPPGFDQTGCDRPCWYGLQAGVSTKEDVKAVLNSFPLDYEITSLYEGNYRDDQYPGGSYLTLTFKYLGRDMVFDFTFLGGDEYLDYMDFGNDVSHSKIIELFGDPDVAIAHSYSRQGPADRIGGTVFFT